MKTEPFTSFDEEEIEKQHDDLVKSFEADTGKECQETDETNTSKSPGNDQSRPIWWSTWRSVIKKHAPTKITDIAEGLEVFDRYKIAKVSDYTSQPTSHRPTLSAWLNIYRGRIGMETFVIYIGAQERWLTVSGQQILDLKNSQEPLPVEKAGKDRSKIDFVYRVTEKEALNYSAGYKDGYELGMSECWIKARDTARKEVWKKAFTQGKQEALIDKEQTYSGKAAQTIACFCFAAGIVVAALLSLFNPFT